MGACHSVDKEEDDRRAGDSFGAESDLHETKLTGHQSRLIKRNGHPRQRTSVDKHREKMTTRMDNLHPYALQYNTAKSLERAIERRIANSPPERSLESSTRSASSRIEPWLLGEKEYAAKRHELTTHEAALAFDHTLRRRADEDESKVNTIIQKLRVLDAMRFAEHPCREGFGGQSHPRFAGDHFLYNKELIDDTYLYDLARHMPKGGHLHLHFNACLLPSVLLDIAKGMERMHIKSSIPLVSDSAHDCYTACEIQFSIQPVGGVTEGDLFSSSYQQGTWMKYSVFRDAFARHCPDITVDEWLLKKLVFYEEEAHGWLQTAQGAWEKFNARTRMMKGLFNYETAYRRYTRALLQDFMDDNIQYAEIRPNFMKTNQLFSDDGTRKIDNVGIMEIIIDEHKNFKEQFEASTGKRGFFPGLKVIYCTPRSFAPDQIKFALNECLEFKKRWPQWIAGFDLVGEEGMGKPLNAFIAEFLQFREDCVREQVDIPFLFHCGETLSIGDDTDGNIFDALLLGAKRIGHGFNVPRHPYVLEKMKEQNMCIELCPISNEVLGLTSRVGGHAMYGLLASNVHCTVSSDNGTLFRSSLSHDFYQVMVGKTDMTLWGWRQLVEWSLEHSCMSDEEREEAHAYWESAWRQFLEWTIGKYGYVLDE